MKAAKMHALILSASCVALWVFVYLLLHRNAPGFTALPSLIALGVAYSSVFTLACVSLARAFLRSQTSSANDRTVLLARTLLLAFSCLLIWVFLNSTLLDYYQPISLFDEVAVVLAVCWGLLTIVFAVLIITARRRSNTILRNGVIVGLLAVLGWPTMAIIPWLNEPVHGQHVAIHRDVFVGGVDGYDIYRIPSLLVLPKGSRLANGEKLTEDRLLAIAEARRDGALDTGVIDLVMKVSNDNGESWRAQQLICRHQRDGMRGKCGNATPVFDRDSGTVFLAYNLSGIPHASGSRGAHQALIKASNDGGENWGEPTLLANDNLVFGPGHGVQKLLAPHQGRLIIPAYESTFATAIYSDDKGASWQRSNGLNTGNETEIAELSNGMLYMTTRHRAPIGRPPEPNGRLYSISSNAGETWPDAKVDTHLPTPICQASVQRYGHEGGLLFTNPSHVKSRVRMTLQRSADNGLNWLEPILIYPGPAGYSVVGVLGNGDAVILFERGVVAYSERITFARVAAKNLLPLH